MRLIRFTLISIVVLFAIASLIGALLPPTVLVSRAENMHVSKDTIFPYLQNIQQWKTWMDGMDNVPVQVYNPHKANFGGTVVEITGITDSTIISLWTLQSGGTQTSTMRLIGDSLQKVTVVQWQFEQKIKWYPWEKFGSMMNDKILGTMMEKNLGNLRKLIERN